MRTGRLILAVLGATLAVPAGAVAATSPSAKTGGASSITKTSAVLHGVVNPNGSETSYAFDIGLTTSYGVTTTATKVGAGKQAVSARATATNLIPGTTYHYRIEATNQYGTTYGDDRTFTTAGNPPPQAQTGPAVNVTAHTVTLTGIVNPNGGETGWQFQYGPSTDYQSLPSIGAVPAGTKPVVVSYTIQNLKSETVFHYRLIAFHGQATSSQGSDAVFMTHPDPKPKPGFSQRTTPRRARHKPYVFTTTGRVAPPPAIPARFACTGNVAVRLFNGRRSVSFVLVPLQPDCTYSAQTTLRRKPGHGPATRRVRLRVAVRFRGNDYLETVSTRAEYVTVG